MADEISSNHGDRFNPKFSASKDPQSSFQLEDSISAISVDEKKFVLIASAQNQDCEVTMHGESSDSPLENSGTSLETMLMRDSVSASSENGGNVRRMVDNIQNLDMELGKETLKVDAVHDSESIGAVQDVNQEDAMDIDFATSVVNFDGNQDCTKKELVQETHSQSILEMKKRLLLEELEAMLVPGEEIHLLKRNDLRCLEGILMEKEKIAGQKNDSVNMNVLKKSLKIEVIDETALVEPILVSNFGNREDLGIVCPNRSMQTNVNKSHDPERGVEKAKRSRKKARELKIPEVHWNPGNVNELDRVNVRLKNAEGNKIVYSRKYMEALRFVNVAEQRRLWEAICNDLMPLVAREYSSITSSNYPGKIGSTSGRRQHLEKREEASSIIRHACLESLDGEIEDMEGDDEIQNCVSSEPSCSFNVSDDDKYYHSLHRRAFLVEGEPNFDSGPPEDGLEYLRRVRWEASQIPNVTVAKVDRSNFKKEQSVYMPGIPAISECPEHLLPSKEWEDAFLSDFSKLRQALSSSEDVQPDFILREVIDSVIPDSIDQPGVFLPANVIDPQQPEELNASTSSKESNCKDYPSLSAIAKTNPVFRVSSLTKHIKSLETQTMLSRTDCLWLFALSAVVDSPLDADSCAAFRCLLRKCASLRAEKTELDDEVIMLNILATISGRYFGQSEN